MSKKKQLIFLGLLAAITVVSVAVSLREYQSVRLPLGSLKWRYIILGLGLMLGFLSAEALCTKSILAAFGTQRSLRSCLPFSFTGFYFSSITPSATGGQPAQVYHMSRAGIPSGQGALTLLLLSICYQLVSLGYALFAWPIRPEAFVGLGRWFGVLVLLGVVTSVALTFVMCLLLVQPKLCAGLGSKLIGLAGRLRLVKQPELLRVKLLRQVVLYRKGSALLRQKPLLLLRLLALTAVQLGCSFAVPYMVYRALGFNAFTLRSFIAAQALLSLSVSFLPLPGAAGASEGVFLTIYTAIFGAGLVAPALLLSRGISFYCMLPISAIVSFIGIRRAKPVLDKSRNAVLK